jgi:outer membrane lipoprotein-sorting protein
MKKLFALFLVLVLLFNSSSTFAQSHFTNNKELDKAFAQLKKSFYGG